MLVEEDGALLGATFGYAKNHSQGEYVFDHGWADAFERAGGRYYPKLQLTVPFTPATGSRLLVRRDRDRDRLRAALAEAVKQETLSLGLSSAHFTFLPDGEWQALAAHGYLHRTDQQFHFENRGYSSHEDFLETLGERAEEDMRIMDRPGTPVDIAPVVTFLLSPGSVWLRGTNIATDGGMRAHIDATSNGLT